MFKLVNLLKLSHRAICLDKASFFQDIFSQFLKNSIYFLKKHISIKILVYVYWMYFLLIVKTKFIGSRYCFTGTKINHVTVFL